MFQPIRLAAAMTPAIRTYFPTRKLEVLSTIVGASNVIG
jgi:hypothetical protein